MTVTVNGVNYENIIWNDTGFTIATDMTLQQLEEAFTPDSEANIVVTEDGLEIARYFNKGIESLTISGSDPRLATIYFRLTQINTNAETQIRENMETTDGAIAELAEMVSNICDTIDETDADKRLKALESWKNDMTINGGVIPEIIARIERLELGGGS